MSTTIADELTGEELARYEHVTARHDELTARITDRKGELGSAAEYLSDAILYTLMRLHSDEEPTTAAPGEVVAFVDEVTAVLHDIRNEAVQESRRRMDAAMERSEALLKGDPR